MDDPGKKERGSAMRKLKPFPLELTFDLILAVLGIIIVFASLKYGFGTFRTPGPGLFPFFIGLSRFDLRSGPPDIRIQNTNTLSFTEHGRL